MKSGMLWFDNDPKRPLTEKVERAAARFVEKYGQPANLCYANPATAEAQTIGAITVKQARSILPNHFWLGVSETNGGDA